MEPLLSGCYTAEDNMLYELLYMLADSENKYLEPSALAGMFGPVQLFTTEEGEALSSRQSTAIENEKRRAYHLGNRRQYGFPGRNGNVSSYRVCIDKFQKMSRQ